LKCDANDAFLSRKKTILALLNGSNKRVCAYILRILFTIFLRLFQYFGDRYLAILLPQHAQRCHPSRSAMNTIRHRLRNDAEAMFRL